MHDSPPPYRTVLFDCDSTLSSIEGIDELAGLKLDPAARSHLVALTRRAMRGEVPLEDVYAQRVEALAPTAQDLQAIGERYFKTLLPGARELFEDLRTAGVEVRILSGGLRPAVTVLARELGVDDACVHAVDVRLHRDGSYADFERDSPLARSGGKLEWLRSLGGAEALGPMALVGDGMTDLECAPELARSIAYAGVARRESVVRAALHVLEGPSLAALTPLLLGDRSAPRTGPNAP